MTPAQRFGGSWTEEKLERVRKYLHAYTTIFKRNPKAAFFKTTYVDGFAGTGSRRSAQGGKAASPALFDDPDVRALRQGSARIALGVEPPFDEYLFIERSPRRAGALDQLRSEFPGKSQRMRMVREEANAFLREWSRDTDWRINRAVVFLDPFGMEVEWATIEALARTKAVDLWLLFPLGQAVVRLLTKEREPPPQWAERLTQLFGTDSWRDEFYPPARQVELFGDRTEPRRVADFDSIGRYFVRRLETVFAEVAPRPLPLRNSREVPIYLLCFAAGHPRGAPTAVKIASHILGR